MKSSSLALPEAAHSALERPVVERLGTAPGSTVQDSNLTGLYPVDSGLGLNECETTWADKG